MYSNVIESRINLTFRQVYHNAILQTWFFSALRNPIPSEHDLGTPQAGRPITRPSISPDRALDTIEVQ